MFRRKQVSIYRKGERQYRRALTSLYLILAGFLLLMCNKVYNGVEVPGSLVIVSFATFFLVGFTLYNRVRTNSMMWILTRSNEYCLLINYRAKDARGLNEYVDLNRVVQVTREGNVVKIVDIFENKAYLSVSEFDRDDVICILNSITKICMEA